MGKFIVKLGDFYFEYSTIVDAPTTFGMTLDDFKTYYQHQYGAEGMRGLGIRLKRLEKTGTSAFGDRDVDQTLAGNRAGPNETTLTPDEILRAYCLREPVKGWLPE